MIKVGSMVGEYQITDLYGLYCIAKSMVSSNKYVVWNIDCDYNGVNTGRYFDDEDLALEKFVCLVVAKHDLI